MKTIYELLELISRKNIQIILKLDLKTFNKILDVSKSLILYSIFIDN